MNSNGKAAPYLIALKEGEKSPLLTKTDDDSETPPASKPTEPLKREGTKEDAPKVDGSQVEGHKPEAAKPALKIDLDGLEQRLIPVPAPPDSYGEIQIVGDRVLLVGENSLKYYDLKARTFGTVAPLAPFGVVPGWFPRWVHLSADGAKVLLYGPTPRVVATTAVDQKPDAGQIHFGQLQIAVHPRQEWRQIFEDTWRTIRDNFYADNLHGVNWAAMRDKYRALIPLVRDRSDLQIVIGWLQAEMNTGHMYASYANPFVKALALKPASLGVETAPESGFMKITRIYKGNGYVKASPLAAPGLGVKEGTYLIEVAGAPAQNSDDVNQVLRGRAGNPIELKVNSLPSAQGARTIVVEPLPDDNALRYYDWVEKNRLYVDRKSNGKLGYIHLYAMNGATFADFIRQYLPQSDKEGIVVDIRYNGGGNLAGPLTTILARKVLMWGHIRNAPDYPGRDQGAFLGHLVCLVNEHSYSEGEGFPFYFRAAKLGPIFGKRTWGGYVGSSPAWPMVDGSDVSVSHYGGWTPKEGWVIEGTGVVPDREIENDPTVYAKGIDSQLDAEIDYLLEKAKKEPVVLPQHPPFPVKPLRGEKPAP
jgi:tricorn protease